MLERMGEFFDSRLAIYDEHQLTAIESARELYRFTAERLPELANARVLDLGCGTGLELTPYFEINPSAQVTGIDLAPGMLKELKRKLPNRSLALVQGSYFEVPFEREAFDAAVSVESLHHFTKAEKLPLYARLRDALKPGGYFILTDYFSATDEEEAFRRSELVRLKREQGLEDGEFYHYDTPLTLAHEMEALREAGFADVRELKRWAANGCIRAAK